MLKKLNLSSLFWTNFTEERHYLSKDEIMSLWKKTTYSYEEIIRDIYIFISDDQPANYSVFTLASKNYGRCYHIQFKDFITEPTSWLKMVFNTDVDLHLFARGCGVVSQKVSYIVT